MKNLIFDKNPKSMKSLLIIGYVWPEPNSSAAGARMVQLISFFRSRGYSLTFATTAAETQLTVNLPEMGVNTVKIRLNHSSFDIFIKNLNPEIVLFDRFMMEEQFGWRVSEICPAALKILDTEDLHFLRKMRQESFKKKVSSEDAFSGSDLAKREIASIYRCDFSLIISEAEMEILKNNFEIPEYLLFYLPFMLKAPSEEKKAALPLFDVRNHFVSIGNFRHEPNWNAVLHLKENIWPVIRQKLPTAEVHIYGAYPPEKAFQLHQPKSGFLIKGRAESSEEVLKKAKVLLAPLRFGAGLKGKLADAMQYGTPVVTTSSGAEGMFGNLPCNGSIEDDPIKFAEAAIRLSSEEKKWKKAQQNGFNILEKRFSEEIHQERLEKKIFESQKQLQNHRNRNFIGAMLAFHSNQSTKHLSKYIEIKNKLEEIEKSGKV